MHRRPPLPGLSTSPRILDFLEGYAPPATHTTHHAYMHWQLHAWTDLLLTRVQWPAVNLYMARLRTSSLAHHLSTVRIDSYDVWSPSIFLGILQCISTSVACTDNQYTQRPILSMALPKIPAPTITRLRHPTRHEQTRHPEAPKSVIRIPQSTFRSGLSNTLIAIDMAHACAAESNPRHRRSRRRN